MKTKKVKCWMKNTISLLMAVVMFVSVAGTAVRARESKVSDGSYLSYIDIETNDNAYKLRGGLRPNIVPDEITWESFIKGLNIKDYLILSPKHIGESDYTGSISIDVYTENRWSGAAVYYSYEDRIYFYYMGYDPDYWEAIFNRINKKEYISLRFGYLDSNRHRTYLYARFARGYNVTYQLDGGKFEKEQDSMYAAGVDHNIPNPVKDGFVFEGWTGTGLSKKTKNLVIKNGDKGDKVYTANWVPASTNKSVRTLSLDTDVTDNTTVENAKIKKAIKNSDGKKVKVSIKNTSYASGYKVQISDKKNFKKVLVSKKVQKTSFNIKSNKLKNKKKLYIRVKAYKTTDSGQVWSENWSGAKKVIIK